MQFIDRCRPKASLGTLGESLAERHLLRCGWTIIHRGFTNAFGEIDLVAADARTVVFVEVKTRSTSRAGAPADAVDATKQARLSRAALAYLKQSDLLDCRARFDVIAIMVQGTDHEVHLDHIENAFEALGTHW